MADELRLWLIGADAVRDFFAAPPELAERLREITATVVPASRRSEGWRSKIGPLMRHSGPGVIQPGVPNLVDGEAMMTGRFVAADRLGVSWIILRAWLDALAAAHTTIPLPADKLDSLEFDLVRAEVPTRVSIRHLWGRGLDMPLRPDGNMSFGYMDAASLTQLVDTWTTALPDLEADTVTFATPLLEFLAGFTGTEEPPAAGMVAWWTAR